MSIKAANNLFGISVIHYFDREDPVAEVCYNRVQWSSIFIKDEKLALQIYSHPKDQDWEFSYEDALEALEKAKIKLLKIDNRGSSLFPGLTETPEQINEMGQKMLEEILNPPQTQTYVNRFGGRDIFEPSGKGARFDREAHFVGFLQVRKL